MYRQKNVIALYIRLSVEDIKAESLSIESQKALLHQYADNLFEGAEVVEYIDNGYSGLNFERPAVQELLNDVQAYKVNCILVKDFSRFGRSSIEVEYFTQQIFPLYNVRFISVSDNYDSNEHKGDTGGLEVSFKYLVNEYYSRDISVKVKTAIYTKMQRGEYKTNNYAYGYLSDKDGNQVIDESVADIVRLIFDLIIEGKSSAYITKVLYDMNIPTPAQHMASMGKPVCDASKMKHWRNSTISQMVRNETYMGMYVMRKQAVRDVGSRHIINRDESEWIKIPNHHPAIVSEEVFLKANKVKRIRKMPTRKKHTYPLRGKVKCGCCHYAMYYKRSQNPKYWCRYTLLDKNEPCYDMRISEVQLHSAVFDVLLAQADRILECGKNSSEQTVSNDIYSEIEKKIAEYETEKQRLYEMLVSEFIGVNEFKRLKEECNAAIKQCKQQLKISQEAAIETQKQTTAMSSLLQIAKDIKRETTLTQELADTLIDRVYVYPDKSVKVEWKIEGIDNYN